MNNKVYILQIYRNHAEKMLLARLKQMHKPAPRYLGNKNFFQLASMISRTYHPYIDKDLFLWYTGIIIKVIKRQSLTIYGKITPYLIK